MRGLFVCLVLCSCATVTTPQPSVDPHSYAQPRAVRSLHLDLDLTLDFRRRVVRGTAIHTVERFDGAAAFVLDTDDLRIEAIEDQDGKPLRWEQRPDADPILGRRLTVQLAANTARV